MPQAVSGYITLTISLTLTLSLSLPSTLHPLYYTEPALSWGGGRGAAWGILRVRVRSPPSAPVLPVHQCVIVLHQGVVQGRRGAVVGRSASVL